MRCKHTSNAGCTVHWGTFSTGKVQRLMDPINGFFAFKVLAPKNVICCNLPLNRKQPPRYHMQ